MEHLGKALLPEDVAVPRQNLPRLLAGITEIGERHRVQLPTIGHAGDGNMHPLLVFDGNDPDETARARAADEPEDGAAEDNFEVVGSPGVSSVLAARHADARREERADVGALGVRRRVERGAVEHGNGRLRRSAPWMRRVPLAARDRRDAPSSPRGRARASRTARRARP